MKAVNLLPSELIDATGELRRIRHRERSMLAAIGFIALWGGVAWIQFSSLRARADDAERQWQALMAQRDEIESNLIECQRLQDRIDAVNRLHNAVPASAAVALMVQLAPESIQFNELLVTWSSLKDVTKLDQPSASRNVSVVVRGATDAPGDIPQFLGRLSDNPYVARVRTQNRAAGTIAHAMRELSIALDVVAPAITEVSGK